MNHYPDPYGTYIAVGDDVAYNYQGEVRLGRIVEIKVKPRNVVCMGQRVPASDKLLIKVQEVRTGKISTVSKACNLVVLL